MLVNNGVAMQRHSQISSADLHNQIRKQLLTLAGNQKLKIYGQLSCQSGKRMSIENRVFFRDVSEAIKHGFRPCGHCMRKAYQDWKNGIV
ncbi:MAG: Ada metal-binding domain-containing protein [Bacteroidota bacterium]